MQFFINYANFQNNGASVKLRIVLSCIDIVAYIPYQHYTQDSALWWLLTYYLSTSQNECICTFLQQT